MRKNATSDFCLGSILVLSWAAATGGSVASPRGEGGGAVLCALPQGRTHNFLKGGGVKIFTCIVVSRVRKINLT